MFPLLIPLLGAGIGAMMNKRNPLTGALLGGTLGYAAPMAGGLLGAAPAAGSQAGMLAAQEAGMGLGGTMGWGGATTGLQGAINSGTAGGLLNTAGKAASTASTIKGLMPQEQPINPAPAFSSGGGNGSVQGMYQNLQAQRLAQQQYEDQMRLRRRGLIG